MAAKLDPLMGLLLEHLKTRAARGPAAAARLARAALAAFDRVVLMSQRVKFSPFVVFRALSLDEGAPARFAAALTDRVCDPVRLCLALSSCTCMRACNACVLLFAKCQSRLLSLALYLKRTLVHE